MIEPTAVLPVKVTLRTRGCLHNLSLTVGVFSLSVVIIFNTPGGNPALKAKSASARILSGVSGEGLMIIVQPAAKAAAALRIVIATGKFQGTNATLTPIGCLITSVRLFETDG